MNGQQPNSTQASPPTLLTSGGFNSSGSRFIPNLVAVILLTASALKTHELATRPTAETDLLTSRAFLVVVLECELVVALWLVSGFLPRLARAVALACFLCFFTVALYQAGRGEASCHCFGTVRVNPWFTAALDAVVIGLLVHWRPLRFERGDGLTLKISGSCLFLFVIAGATAGLTMNGDAPAEIDNDGEFVGDGKVISLDPERWVGKRFPLLKHIDIASELDWSRWIVVLYRRDCPVCRKEIIRFEQMAQASILNPGSPRIALIEVPPYSGESIVTPDTPCALGSLRKDKNWLVETPVIFSLEDGYVLQSRFALRREDKASDGDHVKMVFENQTVLGSFGK